MSLEMSLETEVIDYFNEHNINIQEFANRLKKVNDEEKKKKQKITNPNITLKSGVVVELTISSDPWDVWMNGRRTVGSQETEIICYIEGLYGH